MPDRTEIENAAEPDNSGPAGKYSTRSELVEKAKKMLTHMRIKSIAGELNCTPRHLNRVFHEVVGLSPREYSKSIGADPVSAALELLDTTDKSVNRIGNIIYANEDTSSMDLSGRRPLNMAFKAAKLSTPAVCREIMRREVRKEGETRKQMIGRITQGMAPEEIQKKYKSRATTNISRAFPDIEPMSAENVGEVDDLIVRGRLSEVPEFFDNQYPDAATVNLAYRLATGRTMEEFSVTLQFVKGNTPDLHPIFED